MHGACWQLLMAVHQVLLPAMPVCVCACACTCACACARRLRSAIPTFMLPARRTSLATGVCVCVCVCLCGWVCARACVRAMTRVLSKRCWTPHQRTTRYPGGESYKDVLARLAPVVCELAARDAPLLIISHQVGTAGAGQGAHARVQRETVCVCVCVCVLAVRTRCCCLLALHRERLLPFVPTPSARHVVCCCAHQHPRPCCARCSAR
jgi:hypothetical protein